MDLRELPTGPFRRHPWETVRASFFRDILKVACPSGTIGSVLDIGAGDGWTTEALLAPFPGARVTCWDVNYVQERESGRFRYMRDRPEGRFDLLLLLDVIEHLDDDTGSLKDLLAAHARPDTKVLVSVPAWQGLYCRHDAAFTHRRRYDPATLKKTLESSGLAVERSGGLYASLLPMRVLTVMAEKIHGRKDPPEPEPLLWHGRETTARAAEAWLGADAALSRAASRIGIALPGLSAWALCRVNNPAGLFCAKRDA